MSLRRRLFLQTGPVVFAFSAMAGCTSPPTFYYRLAPIPGAARNGAPNAISVRNVAIPGYLDQNGIAKPGNNYQFNVFGNQIWAEPLADMLQSVMVQDLSQRLPASTVIGSGGSISAPAELLVEMNVLRFDPDASGQITLVVQIAIKSGGERAVLLTQSFTSSATPTGDDAANTAATMSTLWAAAADQVAALVIKAWASQSNAAP